MNDANKEELIDGLKEFIDSVIHQREQAGEDSVSWLFISEAFWFFVQFLGEFHFVSLLQLDAAIVRGLDMVFFFSKKFSS